MSVTAACNQPTLVLHAPVATVMCVQAYIKRSNKHTVTYDDGDSEQLDLSSERWQLLERPKPACADTEDKATAKGKGAAAAAAGKAAKPQPGKPKGEKKAAAAADGAQEQEAANPGSDVVRKRIRVWWPDEKAWFSGKIVVSRALPAFHSLQGQR